MTDKPVNPADLDDANIYAKRRGPDDTNIVSVDKITALHNLLSITGEKTVQPIYRDGVMVVFNGEIYNYGDYECDTDCIYHLYKEYGLNFPKHLDGEFAIALYDFKKQLLVVASDPFKTKPLYVAFTDDHFGVSTYKSSLQSLGFDKITFFPANTIIAYKIPGHCLLLKDEVYSFQLKQYKDTYEDWIEAFKNSIAKRTANVREKIFIGLSSGHDSGAIFCELHQQSVPFMSYSILNNEYKDVINNRYRHRHSSYLTYKFSRTDNLMARKFVQDKVEHYSAAGYDVKTDDASYALSSICRKALSGIPSKIYLSGTGSDEIMSDYSYNGKPVFKSNSCFNGIFPEDLRTIFPWKNFYGGTQQHYLAKEEHVVGAHGIEARYPFLDANLVQEFLYLKASLKNKYYKGPLRHYFEIMEFPYHEFKLGFSPYESAK
ncbi:hypothetical protein H8E06_01200 [bacterium]|nr:hypothetical protein [bacterium]